MVDNKPTTNEIFLTKLEEMGLSIGGVPQYKSTLQVESTTYHGAMNHLTDCISMSCFHIYHLISMLVFYSAMYFR